MDFLKFGVQNHLQPAIFSKREVVRKRSIAAYSHMLFESLLKFRPYITSVLHTNVAFVQYELVFICNN